MNDLYYTQIAA